MATHAPIARVPFAPLDSSRLQSLASAKNRQNGVSMHSSILDGKPNVSFPKPIFSPTKRPLDLSTFDGFHGENVDRALICSPSKKSKNDVSEKPYKPFAFALSPSKAMPPPPTVPSRLTTPARANMSSPRAPMTAPAGRSPKRKASSTLLGKNRRISAPFSRIDPPFSSRSDFSLPFSLDAALSGTFSKPTLKDTGATIQETMPSNWFFDIYEDTPEEEAAIFMEHSTLTLDLSSDEESSVKEKDERGKENMPPEDYDAPAASRAATEQAMVTPARVKKTEIIRKKVNTDDMDDGQRSPLSGLETDYFIPEGLDKSSHVIVDATPEKVTPAPSKAEVTEALFTAPVTFNAGSAKKSSHSTPSKTLYDMPIVNADGDVKGDIIVWEDSPTSAHSPSPSGEAELGYESSKGEIVDENTQPSVEEL